MTDSPELAGVSAVKWRPWHCLLFRFAFVYLVLFNLPRPAALWVTVSQWVAKTVLHIGHDIPVVFNGSGDTTYDFVIVLCLLVVATLTAAFWSVLDRSRQYQNLEQWLKVLLRLLLGYTMLVYGASKIFEGQFAQPGPLRLMETFGEASPMGLLWTFMGASRPYCIFAGLAEFIPGMLFFVPPLTGLAALLCSIVMLNIFMLNLCYDVPVKIYSFHLLCEALYLAWPDLRRLFLMLVMNKPTLPLPVVSLIKGREKNDIALALQIFLGIVLTCWTLWGASMREKREYRDVITSTPMYGVWQVDDCTFAPADNRVAEAEGPWRRLFFEQPGYTMVQKLNGNRQYFALTVDRPGHRMIFSSLRDPSWQRVFTTAESGATMTAESGGNGVPTRLKMHRVEDKDFLLKSRGFNFINEIPFNH